MEIIGDMVMLTDNEREVLGVAAEDDITRRKLHGLLLATKQVVIDELTAVSECMERAQAVGERMTHPETEHAIAVYVRADLVEQMATDLTFDEMLRTNLADL